MSRPQIADHAVIRYLERHYGVDIDAIRAEMECPAIQVATEFGCSVVVLGNGVRLKVREGRVVTCFSKRNGKAPHIEYRGEVE